MAITVQTTASGAGAPVAVENIGTSGAFQLVKLVGGSSGDTSPIVATSAAPAAGAVGMVVREAGTVAVTGAVAVSGGLVSVTGAVGISGITAWTSANSEFFAANALPVVLHQGAIVSANIIGTVPVTAVGTVDIHNVHTTTATSVSASHTALAVVLKPGAVVTVNTAGTVAGASVTIQQGASVSVATIPTVLTVVTILGTQIVSIAQTSVSVAAIPTVNTIITLLGTVAVNVVAGGAGGGSVTTTAPGITATGQVMWIAGGQSTTVSPVFVSQINAPAAGGGSVTTTQGAGTGQLVWLAPTQTIASILSTVNVAIVAGAGGGGSVSTTQGAGTGQLVWLAPTQTLASIAAVNTVVTQLGTAVVTIAQTSVSVASIPTILTIVTQLGTQVVTVVPGVSVNVGSQATGIYTTTATSGATGPIMWLGHNQTLGVVNTLVTQLGTAVVTIAQTSVVVAAVPTVNTVVTILGTQVVTIAQTSVSVAAVPTVNTVVTILSTVNVAIVAGAGGGGSVTTTAPGITATGQVMWIVGGQSTTVSPVFVSVIGGNVVATTSQASGVTGALMYLAASQTIMVTNPRELFVAGGSVANSSTGLIVHPKYNQGMPFMLHVTSTVGGSVGTTLLFTVWTGGSLAGAALTQWAVPAGNVLRLQNVLGIINSSAVTGGTFQIMVNAATASGSFTSAAQATIGRPVMLQMIVSAGIVTGALQGFQADIGGGTTIGVRNTAATAMVIGGAIAEIYSTNGVLAIQPFTLLPPTGTDQVEEWIRMGHDAHIAGNLPAAQKYYNRALRLAPCHPVATHNLGILFAQAGNINEGMLAMERAAMFDGVQPMIAANRALMALEADRIDDAITAANQALALATDKDNADPLVRAGYIAARLSAAMVSATSGQPEKAIPFYNEILEVDPKHVHAGVNSCFVQSLANIGPAELLEQRKKWYAANRYTGRTWPHGNTKDPDRKLKVGYVGGDFKSHSAAMMFSHVLLNHDPAKVEMYLYCSLPVNPTVDDLTQKFMAACGATWEAKPDPNPGAPQWVRTTNDQTDRWRDITFLSDEDAEVLIGKDGIDILVDLAAHTNGGRLGVFTRRPAPIQGTAWGFAHGSGVADIDFFFADPLAIPQEERQFYIEKIIDLPCIVTYRPPVEYGIKESTPAPFKRNEYFTFGSFSRYEKLSDECLACFQQILERVPDSRLFLKDHSFRRPYSIRRVLARLPGIDKSRIMFGVTTSHQEHIQTYQDVDLYLDTYPHGAGIVSLETLYAGVPIITRYGPQPSGRTATSVLTSMSRTDWIARSDAEYVDKAVEWAGRPDELAKARKTLRAELLASPVVAGYPQAVEAAYRTLFVEWCKK